MGEWVLVQARIQIRIPAVGIIGHGRAVSWRAVQTGEQRCVKVVNPTVLVGQDGYPTLAVGGGVFLRCDAARAKPGVTHALACLDPCVPSCVHTVKLCQHGQTVNMGRHGISPIYLLPGATRPPPPRSGHE